MTGDRLNQLADFVALAKGLAEKIAYIKEQIAWCEAGKDIVICQAHAGKPNMDYLQEIKPKIGVLVVEHYRALLAETEKAFADLEIL